MNFIFIEFWAEGAESEQLALAWTLRELQMLSSLDQTVLTSDAGWSVEETVQLIPEEIGTEEMMRIWDALKPDYRLSLSYIARVVRIDPDSERLNKPVVATRTNYAVPKEVADEIKS